jgi:hypothetical protein
MATSIQIPVKSETAFKFTATVDRAIVPSVYVVLEPYTRIGGICEAMAATGSSHPQGRMPDGLYRILDNPESQNSRELKVRVKEVFSRGPVKTSTESVMQNEGESLESALERFLANRYGGSMLNRALLRNEYKRKSLRV